MYRSHNWEIYNNSTIMVKVNTLDLRVSRGTIADWWIRSGYYCVDHYLIGHCHVLLWEDLYQFLSCGSLLRGAMPTALHHIITAVGEGNGCQGIEQSKQCSLGLRKEADTMKLTNCLGIRLAVGVCYPPLGNWWRVPMNGESWTLEMVVDLSVTALYRHLQ